jgi:hypothetical protein
MEYYSAIKKNEIMSFAGKWIELEIIMLSEICYTLEDKYCIFSLLLDLKKKARGVGSDENITRGRVNMVKVHYIQHKNIIMKPIFCVTIIY